MYKIHRKECIDICNDFVPFYQMEPIDLDHIYQTETDYSTENDEACAIAKNYSSCAMPVSKDIEMCNAMKDYAQQKIKDKQLIPNKLMQKLNWNIEKTGTLSSILKLEFNILFSTRNGWWDTVYYKELYINPREDDFSKIDKFANSMLESVLYVKEFIESDPSLDWRGVHKLCDTRRSRGNLTRSTINRNAANVYNFKWNLVDRFEKLVDNINLDEVKLNIPLTVVKNNIIYTKGYICFMINNLPYQVQEINMNYSEPYDDKDFLFTIGKQEQVTERILTKVYDELMGVIGAYEERKRREEKERREKEKREIEARIARQKEYEEWKKARIEMDKLYDEERKKYEQIELSILSKYNSLGFILNDGKPNKVTIISDGNQKEINLKIDIHYYNCGLELPSFKGRLELTLDNGISIIITESNPTQYSSSQLEEMLDMLYNGEFRIFMESLDKCKKYRNALFTSYDELIRYMKNQGGYLGYNLQLCEIAAYYKNEE